MGKSTISMVIFNSYVKLPEGNLNKAILRDTPTQFPSNKVAERGCDEIYIDYWL